MNPSIRNGFTVSAAAAISMLVACSSSSSGNSTPAGGAGAGGSADAGGAAGASGASAGASGASAGASSAGAGGAGQAGTAGTGGVGGGAAGSAGMVPACTIPAQVTGSCVQKDATTGAVKACAVYWGSAFTPATLMTACSATLVLGQNACPSQGSVGACETTSGPTALANYFYSAPDASPANQAQCNSNANHVWCAP